MVTKCVWNQFLLAISMLASLFLAVNSNLTKSNAHSFQFNCFAEQYAAKKAGGGNFNQLLLRMKNHLNLAFIVLNRIKIIGVTSESRIRLSWVRFQWMNWAMLTSKQSSMRFECRFCHRRCHFSLSFVFFVVWKRMTIFFITLLFVCIHYNSISLFLRS